MSLTRSHGTRILLGWLASLPGDTWQQRWHASRAGSLGKRWAAAQGKLAQLDERTRRAATVSLGIPAYRDIAARTATLPLSRP
jgi:hypothetical protein